MRDDVLGAIAEFLDDFVTEFPVPGNLAQVHLGDVGVVEGHGIVEDDEHTHASTPDIGCNGVVRLAFDYFGSHVGGAKNNVVRRIRTLKNKELEQKCLIIKILDN